MHSVGFCYKDRAKHYFVDGHKKPDTLAYRKVYKKRYLEYEIRAHRWIQLPLEEANALEAAGSCLYSQDTGIQLQTELKWWNFTLMQALVLMIALTT